jgi:hypothetical protein
MTTPLLYLLFYVQKPFIHLFHHPNPFRWILVIQKNYYLHLHPQRTFLLYNNNNSPLNAIDLLR